MKKQVEKITTQPRRCGICERLWPPGTHYLGRIGEAQFSCPDGRHKIY